MDLVARKYQRALREISSLTDAYYGKCIELEIVQAELEQLKEQLKEKDNGEQSQRTEG